MRIRIKWRHSEGKNKLNQVNGKTKCSDKQPLNKIILVDNANAEIDSLTSFDPTGDVVVHKEFEKYVSGLNLQKEGEINLKTYEPDRLVYSSNTNSEQLAVFSEVWYGPDKGWQAYIDGKPVDHIRVNYVLRGLKVPAGKHEIVLDVYKRQR